MCIKTLHQLILLSALMLMLYAQCFSNVFLCWVTCSCWIWYCATLLRVRLLLWFYDMLRISSHQTVNSNVFHSCAAVRNFCMRLQRQFSQQRWKALRIAIIFIHAAAEEKLHWMNNNKRLLINNIKSTCQHFLIKNSDWKRGEWAGKWWGGEIDTGEMRIFFTWNCGGGQTQCVLARSRLPMSND